MPVVVFIKKGRFLISKCIKRQNTIEEIVQFIIKVHILIGQNGQTYF